jgi:putative N6-adenine-specific DNA methylase
VQVKNQQDCLNLTNKPAFTKRIRRQIIARNWEFFAVTAPGLEKVCQNEFGSFPFLNTSPKAVKGGVEFSGRVHCAYKANLYLRTANRIMMRIGSFKAANFRQLEKKLSEFSWELFLNPHVSIQVKVSATHSRLYHTDAVRERISEILQKVSCCVPTLSMSSEDMIQALYVRIVNDKVTLSLDSSGRILYKRGIKTHGGKAPLRETTACAALLLAGYDGQEPLIDPMCGSGTFSLEAAMMARKIPPGWFREFAFMRWPCFNAARWKFIRDQAQKEFLHVKQPMIFASDIDPQICRELKKCVAKNEFDDTIKVSDGQDFFTLCPKNLTDRQGLVVLNPPYGFRMNPLETDSDRFFGEIFKKLKKDYKRWKVAMIIPHQHFAQRATLYLKMQPLFHGGLRLFLLYGIIPG